MTEITVNSTNNHKHRRHIETSWAHRTGHRSVSTTFLWEIWSLVLKLNSSALGGILSLPHSHISHLCALSQEHWFPVMRTSLNPHSLCWISRHVTDPSSCWLSITHGVHVWRRHKLVHMHKLSAHNFLQRVDVNHLDQTSLLWLDRTMCSSFIHY